MGKKTTTEDFIKKANILHNNKYDYSKTNYISAKDKIIIICNKHGEFEQVANTHLKPSGCAHCGIESRTKLKSLSLEEFLERSLKIHGDKYNYDNVDYKNNNTKIKIYCNKCKEYFEQLANSHLQGKSHSKCATHFSTKSSLEEFIVKAKSIHGDKYDYSNADYVNAKTKIDIICNGCKNVFEQAPNSHLSGYGCLDCGIKSRSEKINLTNEEFISRAIKVQGNKFDYSKVNYINAKTNITIINNLTKEEFEQTPNNFLRHIRCKIDDCYKNANYNDGCDKTPTHCKLHKSDIMIHITNDYQKCKILTCNTHASFNFKEERKAKYCKEHKEENMIDKSRKLCKLCDLYYIYADGYCSSCFYFTFPEHSRSTNHRSKECKIIGDLNKDLNNIIIQDRIISGGCSKRRPDGLIRLDDYNIIIEIDEDQHNDYGCENKRLMEIFKDLGNSPLTIIRFNPDKYKKENQTIKSPFGITKVDGKLKVVNKNEYQERYNVLLNTIKTQMENYPDKEVNTIHLFYNVK